MCGGCSSGSLFCWKLQGKVVILVAEMCVCLLVYDGDYVADAHF